MDFQNAMTGARLYSGRALVAVGVPGVAGVAEGCRVGVTVSRGVKGSVARNRARRRLREVSRLHLLGPDSPLRRRGIRYDVVLIARPAALDVSFAELASEAAAAAESVARAGERGTA